MLIGAHDPVSDAVDDIEGLLSAGQRKARKLTPRELEKRLPRRLARDVQGLRQAQSRGNQVPYRTQAEATKAAKTRARVEKYLTRDERKAQRAEGLRNWVAGLALNYMIFLLVLGGVWYVATRIN